MGQSKRKKNHRPPSHKHKKSSQAEGHEEQSAETEQIKAEQQQFAHERKEDERRQESPQGERKKPGSGRNRASRGKERNPDSGSLVSDHAPEYVYLVKNPASNETYYCGSDQMIEQGTYVVAPTRYGLDIARVLGYVRSMMLSSTVKSLEELEQTVHFIDVPVPCLDCEGCDCGSEQESPEVEAEDPIETERQQMFAQALEQEKAERDAKLSSLDRIDRIADDYDISQFEENERKSTEAFAVCKEKIEQHKLDMKLVGAHYMLCESKVLFFFTADNRVDFRALVKDLVSVFRMRIELRQIGVRDESRILGGMAVCGRDYCCHGVTDRLNPVSIKMAKEQNLSLNSMKISGPCGRLLCCLSYEYDFYREEKKRLPNTGSRLKIRDELLKITEVNILSKKYHLTAPDGRLLIIPFEKVIYNNESGRWDVDKQYIEEVLSV
jgi:cell fate regulator YaaT (PSP1 superfamily)